jgi:hypothetical protein
VLLSNADIDRVGRFITSLDCICQEFNIEWQFDYESGDVTVYDPKVDLFKAHRWSMSPGRTGLSKAESGFMGRPSVKSLVPREGVDDV